METFAQVGNDNTVVQLVVALESYVKSGALGSPHQWFKVGTDILSKDVGRPGNPAYKHYAVIGYKYVPALDQFLPPDSA